MSSNKLTPDQEEAIKSPDGAKVLVVSMNKEISTLKRTVVKTQNALEGWRGKYHDADKNNGILQSKLEFFVGLEVAKYLLAAVGTSYGINLVTSGNKSGWYYVGASTLAYISITVWQKK